MDVRAHLVLKKNMVRAGSPAVLSHRLWALFPGELQKQNNRETLNMFVKRDFF